MDDSALRLKKHIFCADGMKKRVRYRITPSNGQGSVDICTNVMGYTMGGCGDEHDMNVNRCVVSQ